MRDAAREAGHLFRRAVGARSTISVLGVLALLVGYTVASAGTGERLVAFGPNDGIGLVVGDLRIWVLFLSALLTATRVGATLDPSNLAAVYLAGRRPGDVVVRAAAASALVVTSGFVALLAEAAVLAHLAGQTGIAGPPGSALTDAGLTVAMMWLWSLWGALLGAALAGRSLGALTVTGVLVICLAVERAAVVYPALAPFGLASPLGASSVVVVGGWVPNYPPARASVPLAMVILLGWTALLLAAAARRLPGGRVDAVWQRPRREPRRVLRRGLSTRRAVPLAVGLAALAVGIGVAVPQGLNAAIPWQYKTTWLASVNQGTTPANTMQTILDELAAGRTAVARSRVADAAWAQVLALRGNVDLRATPTFAYDLLIGPGPGSVAIQLGAQRELADGTILQPPTYGACLRRIGGHWQLVSLSADGLTCADTGP